MVRLALTCGERQCPPTGAPHPTTNLFPVPPLITNRCYGTGKIPMTTTYTPYMLDYTNDGGVVEAVYYYNLPGTEPAPTFKAERKASDKELLDYYEPLVRKRSAVMEFPIQDADDLECRVYRYDDGGITLSYTWHLPPSDPEDDGYGQEAGLAELTLMPV